MQALNAEYIHACQEYDKGNYAIAYEQFYALAGKDDRSSQLNIANMLLHGIGTLKDTQKAYVWYKKAADSHDSEAQYIYGWHCIKEGNEKEGIEYLAQSGDGGYADAVYDLAGFFLRGLHSCEPDMRKAMALFEQAAFMGKREALGGLFYTKRMLEGSLKTVVYLVKNIFKLAKGPNEKA